MEQKLASHNSMSYLKPEKWWMRPFRFMAQCQSRDFLAQYNEGVELFDLRFAWVGDDLKKDVRFAHGLMTFDAKDHNPKYVLSWLNVLSAQLNRKHGRHIYIRVLCERPEDNEKFRTYCAWLDQHYKKLTFYGGRDKKTWKVLYDFKNKEPKVCDKYSSWNNDTKLGTGWHLDDLWPRIYAICFNKMWRKKHKDFDEYLMQDFIGVY